jgi:hypothetical protein
MSRRIVTSIEPTGFERNGKSYMRIIFIFQSHSTEYYDVETRRWLQILDSAKSLAPSVSWNELQNMIFYSVAFQNDNNLPFTIS